MNKPLPLFRNGQFNRQERVDAALGLIFEDVYDTIEETRENVRELEKELGRIFDEESCSI